MSEEKEAKWYDGDRHWFIRNLERMVPLCYISDLLDLLQAYDSLKAEVVFLKNAAKVVADHKTALTEVENELCRTKQPPEFIELRDPEGRVIDFIIAK